LTGSKEEADPALIRVLFDAIRRAKIEKIGIKPKPKVADPTQSEQQNFDVTLIRIKNF